jgi:hypothetical protein
MKIRVGVQQAWRNEKCVHNVRQILMQEISLETDLTLKLILKAQVIGYYDIDPSDSSYGLEAD